MLESDLSDYHTAQINIANYVRDGVKHGAIGMINTSWDDDGEMLFNDTWYPFVWGAGDRLESDRQRIAKARQKDFDDAFSAIFYGAQRMIRSASSCALSDLRSNWPASGGLEDRNFWRDNLTDPDPKVTSDDAKNSLPTPTTSPMR